MIKKCVSCGPHAYQDTKYGTNIRVVNELKDGRGYRCTVCGRETIANLDKKKDK